MERQPITKKRSQCCRETSQLQTKNEKLRIPNCAVRGDAARLHRINDLLGELPVGDDAHGLSVQLAIQAIRDGDHVRLAHGPGVVDDGIRIGVVDLLDDLAAKRLLGVGRGPEDAAGDALGHDDRETGPDAAAGGDEHDALEQGRDAQDAAGGDAADPELGGAALDLPLGPVAGIRNHKREPLLARLADGRERVPLDQRPFREADRRAWHRVRVVEVQPDRVVGQLLRTHFDFAQAHPRQHDADGDDDDEPETRARGEGPVERDVAAKRVDREDGLHPDERQRRPAGKPVHQLERVVVLGADVGVGHDDHAEEKGDDKVADDDGREADRDGGVLDRVVPRG